jgi:hypothetical protein
LLTARFIYNDFDAKCAVVEAPRRAQEKERFGGEKFAVHIDAI